MLISKQKNNLEVKDNINKNSNILSTNEDKIILEVHHRGNASENSPHSKRI